MTQHVSRWLTSQLRGAAENQGKHMESILARATLIILNLVIIVHPLERGEGIGQSLSVDA